MAISAQTDNTPLITACNDIINPDKIENWIAVSRDLFELYPCGTKILVTGTDLDGIYIVKDKMNKRYTNRIDILIHQDSSIGKWNGIIQNYEINNSLNTKTQRKCIKLLD